jgi:hypothetical protein
MNDEQRRYDSGTDAGPAQGKGAAEPPRADPAGDPPRGQTAESRVTTLVCELCGKDYSFEDEGPPAGLKCEKCGSTVFRTFETVGGEAADDFRDSTERDLDPDDPEGDTLPGDILDLNRL